MARNKGYFLYKNIIAEINHDTEIQYIEYRVLDKDTMETIMHYEGEYTDGILKELDKFVKELAK